MITPDRTNRPYRRFKTLLRGIINTVKKKKEKRVLRSDLIKTINNTENNSGNTSVSFGKSENLLSEALTLHFSLHKKRNNA